jgi:hypothetical protein
VALFEYSKYNKMENNLGAGNSSPMTKRLPKKVGYYASQACRVSPVQPLVRSKDSKYTTCMENEKMANLVNHLKIKLSSR